MKELPSTETERPVCFLIWGFNIAIIAGALLAGGRQVAGIRIAAWIAIIAVIIYTIFVGAEASVVRAAVMGILMIFAATMLGRPTFLPAVLCGAAFFMTLLNPDILWILYSMIPVSLRSLPAPGAASEQIHQASETGVIGRCRCVRPCRARRCHRAGRHPSTSGR
jgi:hypothetical protein